jgi:hypothetical protein
MKEANKTQRALSLALEALECALSDDKPYIDKCKEAIKALEEALVADLSAPKQEQDGNVCARCGGIVFDPVAKQDQGSTTCDKPVAYPDKCPITRRDFFMLIEHPTLGLVPTYGGPFDSYTIPHMEGTADQPWHERELICHRFDHDEGYWMDDVMGVETIPMRVISEGALNELLDQKEDTTQPKQEQGEPVDEQAAFENWLYRVCPSGDVESVQRQWEASTDFEEVLAKQKQGSTTCDNPVAWGMEGKDGLIFDVICPAEHEREEGGYTTPLYASPPAAQGLVVPLGEEEINQAYEDSFKKGIPLEEGMEAKRKAKKELSNNPIENHIHVSDKSEPVAVMELYESGWDLVEDIDKDWLETLSFGTKLYTRPQPKQEQDSTCNHTLRAQGKSYPRTCKKCGFGPCIGKPKQEHGEPVAWIGDDGNLYHDYEKPHEEYGPEPTPLYTTPQQRKPLTDERLDDIYYCVEGGSNSLETWREQARAIEAAHGIKE